MVPLETRGIVVRWTFARKKEVYGDLLFVASFFLLSSSRETFVEEQPLTLRGSYRGVSLKCIVCEGTLIFGLWHLNVGQAALMNAFEIVLRVDAGYDRGIPFFGEMNVGAP